MLIHFFNVNLPCKIAPLCNVMRSCFLYRNKLLKNSLKIFDFLKVLKIVLEHGSQVLDFLHFCIYGSSGRARDPLVDSDVEIVADDKVPLLRENPQNLRRGSTQK